MTTLGDMKDMMTQTVSISAVTSTDAYGKRTYGSPTTYSARVVDKVRKIRDYKGEEVISSAEAWILGISTLDPATAKITLPTGKTPQIANVMVWPSEIANDVAVKVYFL